MKKQELKKIIKDVLTEKNTKIISAFPGVGKSYIFNNYNDKNNVALDSDSTDFSWLDDKKTTRNPDFPNNYIQHIKENIGKVDCIMISSHKVVRDTLVENKVHFTLVYPEKELKDEYLKRYKERGNDEKFIEMINKNWDNFINELDNQIGCVKIKLKQGEYLSDVYDKI